MLAPSQKISPSLEKSNARTTHNDCGPAQRLGPCSGPPLRPPVEEPCTASSIELRNGSNSEVPISFWSREGNISHRVLAWMGEPRAVGDLAHVAKFFARNLGDLTRARTRAGPAREGRSRTPSMYVGEKSDEVVVPRKRPNKGRQLPAEVVEGRASPEGNSRQAAVVSDTEPRCHVDPIGGCAPEARGFTACDRRSTRGRSPVR
jgi:hypothetical protein